MTATLPLDAELAADLGREVALSAKAYIDRRLVGMTDRLAQLEENARRDAGRIENLEGQLIAVVDLLTTPAKAARR